MARKMADWANVQLGSEAALLLGRRRGVNLEVRSLAITNDLAGEFRKIATATLGIASKRKSKKWTDVAELFEDEAFQIEPAALPERVVPKRKTAAYRASLAPLGDKIPEAAARASSLGVLLGSPSKAPPIALNEARKTAFSFYSVTFTTAGAGPVSFVKQHRSLKLIQGESSFLGFLANDVADTTKGDVLSFTKDFDLIVDGVEILALRDVVQSLFADLDLVAAAVPVMVQRLSALSNLKLDDGVAAAIEEAVRGRRMLARRLLSVVTDPAVLKLKPSDVKAYIEDELRIDSSSTVKAGKLTCTAETAEAFLDYLLAARGRHPYTNELMRLDKRSAIS